jgi:polar amino acid transport system substrate-binding protein
MKKILFLLCAVLLFSGCAVQTQPSVEESSQPTSSPAAAVENDANPSVEEADSESDFGLLTPGILKVGCEIGYPPFEYFADDGSTPIGLDVDLAAEIAAVLGVEVEYENTAWDGIFSGLDIDKYDVVISAVTINAERQKDMDFSQPYIENWQSIAVKKGSTPITSPEEMNGLKIAYQEATTSDDYITELIELGTVSCEVNEYDKVTNCFDDLRLGRVDAVLADSVVVEGYISREPGAFEISWIQSSDPDAEAEIFGVALKKGNSKLQDVVNEALKTLEENGKLDELRATWLS